MGLRKKWNDICLRQHQGSQIVESDTFGLGSEACTPVMGLPYFSGNQTNRNIDGPQGQSIWGDVFPVAVGSQKISSADQSISFPAVSGFKIENLIHKQQVGPPSSDEQINGFPSHAGCLSDLGTPDELTSPSSVSSVSTDLMLGTIHTYPSKKENCVLHPPTEPLRDLPGCPTSMVDVTNGNVSAASVQYSSCLTYSDPTFCSGYLPVQSVSGPQVAAAGASICDQQNLRASKQCQAFDIRDFKAFCRRLTEKVDWQLEAVHSISRTLACRRAGNESLHGATHGATLLRGDIWLGFLGPDKFGKRRIAKALAEILFGSGGKLICVDLSTQEGLVCSNTLCSNCGINGYDLNFRGKTVVDHIAEEIRKKPWSVVLLESVDKADLLVQSSLSQAIRTGKFSDSHGREIDINNVVFVTTAGEVKGKAVFSCKDHVKFSEERILAAQARQMKILIEAAPDSVGSDLSLNSPGTSVKEPWRLSVSVSKRKLDMGVDGNNQCESTKRANKKPSTFLDLNLPVEETAANCPDYSSGESNSVSDNSDHWIGEFLDAVDETVVFRPFDFDALADEILKEIDTSIQAAMGSECVLEIDPKVMEHVLAAAWLSEGKPAFSNWLQQVLVRSFLEVRQVYNLCASSVLRLVSCEGTTMEDHAPGILLPSRILLRTGS